MGSCKNHNNASMPEKKMVHLELMEADKSFSVLSEQKGMRNAFIECIDSNGVLLRANYLPMVGANAIDFLIQQDDSGYKLSLNPQHAEVSSSGEWGYTYGIYALRPNSIDTVIYGSYTNIWKKQIDGKWKLLLNSGNEGIGK